MVNIFRAYRSAFGSKLLCCQISGIFTFEQFSLRYGFKNLFAL